MQVGRYKLRAKLNVAITYRACVTLISKHNKTANIARYIS